jgi:hypothetical protein
MFSLLFLLISLSIDSIDISSPSSNDHFLEFVHFSTKTRTDVGFGSYQAKFGSSISVDGDRALFGGPTYAGTKGGAWYYEKINGVWEQKHAFLLDGGNEGDKFGIQVALKDDKAIISGRYEVFCFQLINDEWHLQQTIRPNSVVNSDYFGYYSLVYKNNTLMIGAVDDDDAGPNHGAVYVFEYMDGTWVEVQKITHPTITKLGLDIDIEGNRAIISAKKQFDGYGVVVFFQRINGIWIEEQIISAATPMRRDGFGASISLSGNRALIGAYNSGQNGLNTAFIFDFDGMNWVETRQFDPSHIDYSDTFGNSVLLSGNKAFVSVFDSIYSYHFDGQDWLPQFTTLPFYSGIMDSNNTELLIGAPLEDDPFTDSGSVFIYDLQNENLIHESTLSLRRGSTSHGLGENVKINGNVAMVKTKENANEFKGVVDHYRLVNDQWMLHQTIENPTTNDHDHFGTSLDFDDNFLVVGDSLDDSLGSDAGMVYVFENLNGTWTNPQQLYPSNTLSNGDRYGRAVAIDGDFIIAGFNRLIHPGADLNSVFVFKYDGNSWHQSQELSNPLSQPDDEFGKILAINGSSIFISADLNILDGKGSVYVFSYDGQDWIETQKLVASDAPDQSCFGSSLAASENVLLIGNHCRQPNGSVYVFNNINDVWVETQILTTTDVDAISFGAEISIDNNHMLIGSRPPYPDAYIFRLEGTAWQEKQKVSPPIHSREAGFSNSVSISNDFLMIGDPTTDFQGSNSGSLYFFKQKPDLIFADSFDLNL